MKHRKKSEDNFDFNLSSVFDNIASRFRFQLPKVKKRLAQFKETFDITFPDNYENKHRAYGIIWAFLEPIIAHYSLGNNGSVMIELYAILEKLALRDLPRYLTNESTSHKIIMKLIEKKTLAEVAEYFVELKIWSDEDLIFIRKLSKIRNGIAHQNEKLISKAINGGKELYHLEITQLVNKHDTKDYIIKAIELILKSADGKDYRGP